MTAANLAQTVSVVDFAADDFAGLALLDDRDLDALGDFTGEPRAPGWKPVRMCWTSSAGLPVPDIAQQAGGLVLNERARDVLGDLLQGRGELLDLDVQDAGPHWIFNVTRISDALDEHASELKRFRSGRIMDIERYVFDPAKLAGDTIFRLRQRPALRLYCTDAFKRRVEQGELRGLDFIPIWPA